MTARLKWGATAVFALLLAQTPGAQSPDVPTLSRKAAQAMSEHRFDDAVGVYRDLLKVLPDDSAVLMGLGMALVKGGHPAEAVAPLERAVALNGELLSARALLGSSYLALGQPTRAVASLERVVTARPADVESRRMLAEAYGRSGRRIDALKELHKVTALAPKLPSGWYELGQAYNAVAEEAMATFGDQPEDSPWRQLLIADALVARGPVTDAFFLYRQTLERLPSMVSIHDSVALIYEQTGHLDWAAREREEAGIAQADCGKRRAICEFRAGRHRSALDAALLGSDAESRYWRVRASSALALDAFKQLDSLPDGLERRAIRATRAKAEERYTDAVAELKAALTLAPGVPALVFELASAYYAARDYEQALATVSPLLEGRPDDPRLLTLAGDALLELRRPAEAIPLLQRAVERNPADPAVRSALGRAYFQNGDFAAAAPLIEAQLASDQDGSLHVQLARAYRSLGKRDEAVALLARSEEIQRAAEDRRRTAAQRMITPPK
jgi:predicted Zn-dependent protease